MTTKLAATVVVTGVVGFVLTFVAVAAKIAVLASTLNS